jgi:ankyrin repeat protein
MILRTLALTSAILLAGCSSEAERTLIAAAGEGDVEQVRTLLDNGANVDAVALDDWTPLTRAADKGQMKAVELLIRRGASINKPSGDLTPLFFAARNGHTQIAKFLVEHGAKLDLPPGARRRFVEQIRSFHDPELFDLLSGQL